MKRIILNLSLAALATSFVACEGNDDQVLPQQARVMVVHASPNAPAVDVRVNNNVARTGLAYPTNTGYVTVNSGANNFKVSPTGTTTYVIDANVNLDPNGNYSVFAVDSVSKIKAAVVADNLAAPAAGKAHIRFFHFSPNAPAVDILAGSTVLFPNRTFNDQSNASLAAFTPVDAGTYTVNVRLTGTSTIALSIPNVQLQAGKIYTVFAKGFAGATGAQALGAEIIVNN
jgi:hypothetical protein